MRTFVKNRTVINASHPTSRAVVKSRASIASESNPGGVVRHLPRQLIVTPETVIDEMNSTTGWTATNGTVSLNTTEFKTGTGSVKLTSNEGVSARIDRAITPINLDRNGLSFKLWAYPHSEITTTITGVTIYLGTGVLSINTNHYVTSISGSSLNIFELNKWCLIQNRSWTKVGDASFDNVNKIRILVTTVSGQVSEMSFDYINANLVRKPAVMYTFDDNYRTIYTAAYQAMRVRKIVGTFDVISSLINDVHITESEILEMYRGGWTMANHTATHPNLTTLTEEEIITELTTCANKLIEIGVGDGKHVGYPYGVYNDTVLAAMTAFGAKTGRYQNVADTYYDINWPYNISCNTLLSF